MSHESFLPCVSHDVGGIICEGEDMNRYKKALQSLIGQKDHGKNERFIVRETRSGDKTTLTLELLQFYTSDVLDNHLGLK